MSPTVPVLLVGVVLWSVPSTVGAEVYLYHHENVMGTAMTLHVLANDAPNAARAEGRVLCEIDRLSAILSEYDPTSEFLRWQDGPRRPITASPELVEMFQKCDEWRMRSGGCFDPRVEALTRLWSASASRNREPTDKELSETLRLMSLPAWRLDPRLHIVERMSECPLTFNAIAKGAIVERACHAGLNKEEGVLGLMLNVGGDLRVAGQWSRVIGVASPEADSETTSPIATIEVSDRAVATSGRSQRGFRVAGRWYSHIFDPRTGRPVDRTSSATVIAPRSADADALATTFNVLAPEESLQLARSLPGVDCLIVTAEGRVVKSEGWKRYEHGRALDLASADPSPRPAEGTKPAKDAKVKVKEGAERAPAPSHWGDEHELLVSFEINSPKAEPGRYRRPYVAVWVEDAKGFPVRNLVLWVSFGGAGPFQWLPELTRWHRADRARRAVDTTDMVDTIARPTRPAGKYSVIWDGKNDQGVPVDRGEYTLFIEAAREHGTYQSIRKRLTIADSPFTEELKGNVEIKAASVAYRKKSRAK
jgi:thiamine biosynthesis lipoprotein ApbE